MNRRVAAKLSLLWPVRAVLSLACTLTVAWGFAACGGDEPAQPCVEDCETSCATHEDCPGLCTEGICSDPNITECEATYADDGSMCVSVAGVSGGSTLFNFRITDGERDRVFFDAIANIAGLSATGFIISGKTVAGVTVDSDGLGGYFTVSEPFNFWDNHAIRLESGDGVVPDFTLEYIRNTIAEPAAEDHTYYVDIATGDDGDDGSTEDLAFATIGHAVSVAQAGSTIWVKAGTYPTTVSTDFAYSGTVTNPIKFIGYKSVPGDIESMYYSFTAGDTAPPLDPSEMPLMDGGGIHRCGLRASNQDYIIIRNLQVTGYFVGICASGGTGVIVDNCVTKDQYGEGHNEEGGGIDLDKGASGGPYAPSFYRIVNSIAVNSGMANIRAAGAHNLIDNSAAYCDKSMDGGWLGSDYYVSISGDYNIVRNTTAEAIDETVNNDSHGFCARGQSIGTDSWGSSTRYNLFQSCYIKTGSQEGVQARNPRTDFNVFKDIEIAGFGTGSAGGYGISNQTGAKNNTYDRIYMHDLHSALTYKSGTEGGTDPDLLHISGNVIRNSVIDNVMYVMRNANAYPTTVMVTIDNNKIYNTTINNAEYLNRGQTTEPDYWTLSGNEFVNCIFNDVTDVDTNARHPTFAGMWGVDHSNFSDNGFSTPTWVTDVTELSPNFADPGVGDFSLTDSTPLGIRDGGLTVESVQFDMAGKRRSVPYSIGAFEWDAP